MCSGMRTRSMDAGTVTSRAGSIISQTVPSTCELKAAEQIYYGACSTVLTKRAFCIESKYLEARNAEAGAYLLFFDDERTTVAAGKGVPWPLSRHPHAVSLHIGRDVVDVNTLRGAGVGDRHELRNGRLHAAAFARVAVDPGTATKVREVHVLVTEERANCTLLAAAVEGVGVQRRATLLQRPRRERCRALASCRPPRCGTARRTWARPPPGTLARLLGMFNLVFKFMSIQYYQQKNIITKIQHKLYYVDFSEGGI